ncbi:hypothetical protein LZ30DRAFT_70469 [Colletotrichum cereale]|nr:hypothetical protein LZ30DRAFT_70469 [Colletotrichum cereale]
MGGWNVAPERSSGCRRRALKVARRRHLFQASGSMAPRKKYTFRWTCCYCGQGGMSISSEGCINCGYGRCARCRVDKLQVRQHLHYHLAPCQHAHT